MNSIMSYKDLGKLTQQDVKEILQLIDYKINGPKPEPKYVETTKEEIIRYKTDFSRFN